jgi:hypothetical protein
MSWISLRGGRRCAQLSNVERIHSLGTQDERDLSPAAFLADQPLTKTHMTDLSSFSVIIPLLHGARLVLGELLTRAVCIVRPFSDGLRGHERGVLAFERLGRATVPALSHRL